MGLFGKKKEEEYVITDEKSDEAILKEELEEEVGKLQKQFRTIQEEIKENERKVQAVKEEYDSTVANLMEIKKETNQRKMELDVVKREYRDTKQKIEGVDEKYKENKKLTVELEKTETDLKNSKKEIEVLIKKDIEIKEKISEGQSILHEIKLKEIQIQSKLEEVTSRLYKSKQELENSGNTGIFTNKEKKFIKDQIGGNQETKGIIEAASVVTASLKSKLSMSQKELEAIQQLLEKERKEHELAKEKLKNLQNIESKNKS
jgi:chromosome segregation ATPase